MLVGMKEKMITITDYMLLVKNVLVYDVQNIIRKTEKKYWNDPDYIEKTIKIKLNEIEKLLIHTQKIYKIFTIRLIC